MQKWKMMRSPPLDLLSKGNEEMASLITPREKGRRILTRSTNMATKGSTLFSLSRFIRLCLISKTSLTLSDQGQWGATQLLETLSLDARTVVSQGPWAPNRELQNP